MGIHRSAHPLDRLKRRFLEYQKRIISSEGQNVGEHGAYKIALKQAMAKAQRAMLGNKVGSTSMSANTIRGFGGQGGLEGVKTKVAHNGARPAIFKDKDGEDVFVRTSVKGGWSDVGTSAIRRQESQVEAKNWKGEVLPQREVITPKKPAIAVYRDSDEEEEEEEEPVKAKGGDVFTTLAVSKEPSDTDRLRRNPLMHYSQDKKLASVPTKKSKAASSSKVKDSSSSTSLSKKKENYSLPLHLLYPGIKLEDAGQRKSKKEKSEELSVEEVLAIKRGWKEETDSWAYLNDRQGKWLPELKRLKEKAVRKDATVTAFTRDAQDQVMEMFNRGMVDSDDESSDEQSDSEEDEEDEPLAPIQMMLKENSTVPPTPTPAPKGFSHIAAAAAAAAMATPIRKPLGERKADGQHRRFGESKASSGLPQRLESDQVQEQEEEEEKEEGSDSEEEEEIDYLNAPMREMLPLSPITEATECTRYTHNVRTPGATSRYYQDDTVDDETHERISLPAIQSIKDKTDGDDIAAAAAAAAFTRQAPDEVDNSLTDTASESGGGCVSTWVGSQLGDKDKSEKRMPAGYTIEANDDSIEECFNASLVIVEDIMANPCCPIDPNVINTILANLSLSIESSSDYVDCREIKSGKLEELQKRAQLTHRRTSSSSNTSATNLATLAQGWTLEISNHTFPILQKLGEGGYGAVFLAKDDGSLTRSKRLVGGINGDASFVDVDKDEEEKDDDSVEMNEEDEDAENKLIAIKVETPPNRWEFYILGQLRARLSAAHLSSIICARKFFCFQDESFLLLEYEEKGTLLEIVNNAVKAGVASSTALVGQASGSVGIDELLALFFIVEIIKVVESLHSVDLLHGDLKIDNCLLRLEEPKETWTNQYNRHGENGWSAKGITLIDFGRAIDLRQFKAEQRFLADWTCDDHDCFELQTGQSWKYEIDYHGIASIAYCLLFGKYIEVIQGVDQLLAVDKPFRRYWQVDLWTALFRLCLNSGHLSKSGGVDVAKELKNVRLRMETYLEENCFRAGKVRLLFVKCAFNVW